MGHAVYVSIKFSFIFYVHNRNVQNKAFYWIDSLKRFVQFDSLESINRVHELWTTQKYNSLNPEHQASIEFAKMILSIWFVWKHHLHWRVVSHSKGIIRASSKHRIHSKDSFNMIFVWRHHLHWRVLKKHPLFDSSTIDPEQINQFPQHTARPSSDHDDVCNRVKAKSINIYTRTLW